MIKRLLKIFSNKILARNKEWLILLQMKSFQHDVLLIKKNKLKMRNNEAPNLYFNSENKIKEENTKNKIPIL